MKSVRYKDLNLGNGIFEGWNDQQGLMICGYEWGNSKKDQSSHRTQSQLILISPVPLVTKFRDMGRVLYHGSMIIELNGGLLYGGIR